MFKKTNTARLLAIVAALLLFASACGDDGGTDAGTDTPTTTAAGEDDDTTTTAAGEDDDTTTTTAGEDDETPSVPSGVFDCAEIQAAVESATELAGGSDTPNDPEESFNQSRAALVALGEQAPEIADDVAVAVAALDDFAAVMARYNWTTDFSENPSEALEFSQAILAEGNIMELTTSMSAISAWITTSCVPS